MTSQHLRQLLTARPFRPFTIRTADGTRLRIRHPELAALSPSGRVVVVFGDDDAFQMIDVLMITILEGGNGHPRKRNGRSSK